jgi:hypothetical protein
MKRCRALFFFFAALALAPSLAGAQPAQAPLTPAEQRFYHTASTTLQKLYPHPAQAEKAGWFRYNNEDESGAISYINLKYFDTPDPAHPQQLWYDVHGRLLGGDFTQKVDSAPHGPTLFGISAKRFQHSPLHVHFGIKHADGSVEYGDYVPAATFKAAGLDPLHPTAANLVALGKVKSTAEVAFVFAALNNYDATMWLIPNPAGQFADLNPLVKPSPNQGKSSAEHQM